MAATPLAFVDVAPADVEELVQQADQAADRLRPLVARRRLHVQKLRTPALKRPRPALLQAEVRNAIVHGERLKEYLVERGVSAAMLSVMQSWIKLSAAVEVAQLPEPTLPATATVDAGVSADAFEPLSAAELGQQLGISASMVRVREQGHELFAVLPHGRERGRVYPAFQAWPDIAGAPLSHVLQALGQPDGGTAWGFFSSTSRELEELTPVEVLSGRLVRARPITDSAQSLLDAPADVRRAVVEGAARVDAAVRAA